MDSKLFYGAAILLIRLTACLKPTPKGLYPPVYTPYDDNGNLNLDLLPEYAYHLKSNSIDGVIVAATTGECTALSINERKDLLDAWLRIGKPIGLTVIMQVGGMPLPHVLEMANYAESVGADAILCLPELYFRPKTEEDAVMYLNHVSQAAPSLPLFYYDNPRFSGVTLNLARLFSLATEAIPNFKGSSCDLEPALQITAANDLKDDQTLLIAGPITTAANYLMGLNNTLSFTNSLFPELMLDIRQAFRDGDIGRTRDLQIMFNKLIHAIFSSGDIIPAEKAAMEMVTGMRFGDTRDPVTHLSAEQRRSMRRKLQQLGVPCVSE